MVVKMKIEFLSLMLLCSLCQAFPATPETETYTNTPQKPPSCNFFRKCCEKFRLTGDKSMFKDFCVSTGNDYKPPPKNSGRRRGCCPTKHPEDSQQPPSNTTVADEAAIGITAYDLGKAQSEHGLVPDMDMGATDGSGVALGVDGGTGVGEIAIGGGCGDDAVACICTSGQILGKVLKFFCCDAPQCLCCCDGGCDSCPML